MITIYHNPRCAKSREGLKAIESSGQDYQIVKYLDDNLSAKELTSIIDKLDLNPVELVRKNEKIWKENYKNKDLTNKEIVDIMVKNPKLIERPIVIVGKKAVIGRPTENITKLLTSN